VLLAGNGHVRRDIGVPRWLQASPLASRLFVVGLLESDEPAKEPGAFDIALVTAPAERADPCAPLRAAPPR
jgi:uncharacterized iron-regulated protein